MNKNESIEQADKKALFIKALLSYYRDFLETDFKNKKKSPKRSILNQKDSEYLSLIVLNNESYPSFYKEMLRKISDYSIDNIDIPKGKHKQFMQEFSKNSQTESAIESLFKVIGKEGGKIQSILNEIKIEAAQIRIEKEFTSDNMEALSSILKKTIIPYLMDKIAELDLKDIDLKEELTDFFCLTIANIYKEALSKINKENVETNDTAKKENKNTASSAVTAELFDTFQNQNGKTGDRLSEIFKRAESNKTTPLNASIKKKITAQKEFENTFTYIRFINYLRSFFNKLPKDEESKDLFEAGYEIRENKNLSNNEELYLYFCDISFDNEKYPLFYIPIELEIDKNAKTKLTLKFAPRAYINKRVFEYISAQFNDRFNRNSNISVGERIFELEDGKKDDFKKMISDILSAASNSFNLNKNIYIDNFDFQYAVNKEFGISISNNLYIALFDKGDEAIVNDYEELLNNFDKDSSLAGIFSDIIIGPDGFISEKEPIVIFDDVDEEWGGMEICDRLVFDNPIPLNREQRKILSAINNDKCKYIEVQGPPGTGKSHTITGIIFDLVLKGKSVLVLSDKKEALDVVEDKITQTMDKNRQGADIQNAILRLGKTGNNIRDILNNNAIAKLQNIIVAYQNKNSEALKKKQIRILTNDLNKEISEFEEISLEKISQLCRIENIYEKRGCPVDIEEILNNKGADDIEDFRKAFLSLKEKTDLSAETKELIDFSIERFQKSAQFLKYLQFIKEILSDINSTRDNRWCEVFFLFDGFCENSFLELERFIKLYSNLKIFGFIPPFPSKKIDKLNGEFAANLKVNKSDFKFSRSVKQLIKFSELCRYALSRQKVFTEKFDFTLDYLKLLSAINKKPDILAVLKDLTQSAADIELLEKKLPKYPNSLKQLGLDLYSFKTMLDNELSALSEADFKQLKKFISLRQETAKYFQHGHCDYKAMTDEIQTLAAEQMSVYLSDKAVNSYQNRKSAIKTIVDIVRKKGKFPKEYFELLKETFPCIIAGIRDYSQYIPLELGMFDLIIIDEASQVSVAQAFPALLRAKKVLVLGDKEQFSNVKTAFASTDANNGYKNNIAANFKTNISQNPIYLSKLQWLDIKTSILEFLEHIRNYGTSLRQHFRSYKEIISFSNKHFYENSLQIMKITDKNIQDIIEFSYTENTAKSKEGLKKNTNAAEVDKIIDELEKMKNNGDKRTVGIITPHTNQQKLLQDRIRRNTNSAYFYDTLKLKIMTFDSCQGEERDIVFYSMVADKENDGLTGIFLKSFDGKNTENDGGSIRAQRLNVGFSRAKEKIHFVLSKKIEDFNGTIGEALRYYNSVLEEAKKQISPSRMQSPMEIKVKEWFYQTDFYKQNGAENIQIEAQYEIGKLFKQLDPSYNHPSFRVDFHLLYKNKENRNREHKIVIEYDGFKEHFIDAGEEINESNYMEHYNPSDIERQKIIEGYGYKFLRINKFNIGENPIETLDKRLKELTR
ncbi:MAG: hypothetical protein LBH29_03040 [Elusimicrobiota bacterium]|jgi:hypothetical protein|nr:hypothetical protein [Elusimicrobiota bacterium]